MANTPATGNGPFEFTDPQGHQISIPLSAFSFDSSNAIVVDPAWTAVTGASPASELLAYAVKRKLIAPQPTATATPAMVVKAADSGKAGNNITVQISGVAANPDPTLTTFTITVTETDTYTGLTAATIQSVLGTCNSAATPVTTGSSPGLVQVLSGSVDTTGSPSPATAVLSGDPAKVDIDGSGSPARVFTLVAKKAGAAGSSIRVNVSPVVLSPPVAGPETFNLTATLQQSVSGVTIGTLATAVASNLGYEITVSTPGSGAFSVPAASSVTLSGGDTGVKASGIVSTGS
jgi:hypothetical protein